MKDRELCTNNTTDCNGKKGKQSEERRKTKKKRRSQDKPYFARKSAWVSLSGIIS